jgi:hypothetical protein
LKKEGKTLPVVILRDLIKTLLLKKGVLVKNVDAVVNEGRRKSE